MISFKDIATKLETYLSREDINLTQKAYTYCAKVHGGQVRLSGEAYLSHPLEVANILADLHLDAISVAAGLLHDTVEDTHVEVEDIRHVFGDTLADLVEALTKISQIEVTSAHERQADNFRKMLMAMSHDLRVIIVKLADRVHNMCTLEFHEPERRNAIAQETMDIYAPLANRLGLGGIKEELEDRAFRYLKPQEHEDINHKLIASKKEREAYLQEVIDALSVELKNSSLDVRTMGRTKTISSIHRKLVSQNITIDQIYDITALRIITDSVRDCYAVLGVIHSLWMPIPGRFKDFIALPKANMYQSIHTTVMGSRGHRVEFQVRTDEMHKVAESGIAAHWLYKEGRPQEERDDERFNWLRQLLEWQKEVQDPKEFMRTLRTDLFQEEVYVFTPKGRVIELPRDATPVDFAYQIHTDIGNHCASAKVNGRTVPLKQKLENGQIVEIVTQPHHKPSRDWLKFVMTARARSKIRSFLRSEEKERAMGLGSEILEKELERYEKNSRIAIPEAKELKEVAHLLGLSSADEMILGLGFGWLAPRQVVSKILAPDVIKAHESDEELIPSQELSEVVTRKAHVKVKNFEDLLVRPATCCSPVRGEPIVGYITRGRGVTIHGVDCPNVGILDYEPDRRVEVEWDLETNAQYLVELRLESVDEPGIMAKVSGVIAEHRSNIVHVQAETSEGFVGAVIHFGIKIQDFAHLEKVLRELRTLSGVLKVERVKGVPVRN